MNLENQPGVPRPKVLIVDDSATVRQILSIVLGKLSGVEVVGAARDGCEAMDLIHQLNPDLVTLDLDMPKMGGLEVLAALQQEHSKAEVLVFSGVVEAEPRQKCLELGAKEFFDKDKEFDRLVAVVGSHGDSAPAKNAA